MPPQGSLVSASGAVKSVIKQKSSVKFSLQGERHFQHLSQSGDLRTVYEALSAAGSETVTVWFDPEQSWQPAMDENAYHTVYQIHVAERTLLRYEQVRAAWQVNQQIGKGLGMAFLFVGAALVIFARLRKAR